MQAYRIDWNDVMEGYNKRYKTHYTDLKTWLSEFYELTASMNVMGRRIGIDASTMNKKMRSLGIKINRRGGVHDNRAHKRHKFLTIPAKDMESMSIYEIMKIAGTCFSYTTHLAQENGRKYKRLRKGPLPTHIN